MTNKLIAGGIYTFKEYFYIFIEKHNNHYWFLEIKDNYKTTNSQSIQEWINEVILDENRKEFLENDITYMSDEVFLENCDGFIGNVNRESFELLELIDRRMQMMIF